MVVLFDSRRGIFVRIIGAGKPLLQILKYGLNQKTAKIPEFATCEIGLIASMGE